MEEIEIKKAAGKIEASDKLEAEKYKYRVDDEGFEIFINHMVFLASGQYAGACYTGSTGKYNAFEDTFIEFDKAKNLILIKNTLYLYMIKNADIRLEMVDNGYRSFSIAENKWGYENNEDFMQEIYSARMASTVKAKTILNYRNIITITERFSEQIKQSHISTYLFAMGKLEKGEVVFPIYKNENEEYALTNTGIKFPVHSQSVLTGKGITSGASYLCEVIKKDGEVGLNVKSKFGFVRSGIVPTPYGSTGGLLLNSTTRFNDIDPAGMECSNSLVFYNEEGEEASITELSKNGISASFEPVIMPLLLLRDICISFMNAKDSGGSEKMEMLICDDVPAFQDGRLISFRHLPTKSGSPFIDVITIVAKEENKDKINEDGTV